MSPKAWFLTSLAVAIPAAAFFGTAAVSADGALHPPRLAVAAICPCIARVQCDDASVTSPDGALLKGWYFRPESANGAAVILLHGVGGNRGDMVHLGTVFEKAGYAVLAPDLRGHGASGGMTTYGVREEQDVRAWADWMLSRPGVNRIYGFGVSLGGSVLLESLRRESRFRAVVAESAYSDFPAIAQERIGRQLPGGLKWLAYPFVDSALLWGRLRYNEDLRQASAIDAVRRTHVPALLIHGLGDRKTEADNSRLLAAANPSDTELWLVPGAGHANVWESIGKPFEQRVLSWFSSHP